MKNKIICISLCFCICLLTLIITSTIPKLEVIADNGESYIQDITPMYTGTSNEQYTSNDSSNSLPFGDRSIGKLKTNVKQSGTVGSIPLFYVTEEGSFKVNFQPSYRMKENEEIAKGWFLSYDTIREANYEKLKNNAQVKCGVILVYMQSLSDSGYKRIFTANGNSIGEQINGNNFTFSLSGEDMYNGAKIKVVICYEIYKKSWAEFLFGAGRTYKQCKEVYEFCVIKDTNKFQILNKDKDENYYNNLIQQDPTLTDEDIEVLKKGETLQSGATVLSGFSLNIDYRHKYSTYILNPYNFTAYYVYNKFTTNSFYLPTSRFSLYYRYNQGNEIKLFDPTTYFTSKTDAENTYKKTFTEPGRYDFKAVSISGKVSTTTIYIFDSNIEDKGYSLYFKENMIEGNRIYDDTVSYPTYKGQVKLNMKGVDSSLVPFLYGTINNLSTGEVKNINSQTVDFSTFINSPGSYLIEFYNGNPNAGGTFYVYSFQFTIKEDATYPPKVNKSIIDNLRNFSMVKSEILEYRYKTNNGYDAIVIWDTESYNSALDFAYNLEKIDVITKGSSTWVYKDKEYISSKELTQDLYTNAESKLQKNYIDYGFFYSSNDSYALLQNGADIRELVLTKDTYVCTFVELENIFTEDLILPQDFKFTKTEDYESQNIKAKLLSTNEIIDILYEKPLKEQLSKDGIYEITETNVYGEQTIYYVNIYHSLHTTLFTENSTLGDIDIQTSQTDISSMSKVTFTNVINDFNLQLYIKIINVQTNQAFVYNQDSFKDVTLENGAYVLYIAEQSGLSKTFTLTIGEVKNLTTNNDDNLHISIIDKAGKAIESFVESVDNTIKSIQNGIHKVTDSISNGLNNAGNAINNGIHNAGNAIGNGINKVKDFFKSLFK